MKADISPWSTYKDDDYSTKYFSLKQIAKPHTKSTYISHKSTQLDPGLPCIDGKLEGCGEILRAYRSREVSVILMNQLEEDDRERRRRGRDGEEDGEDTGDNKSKPAHVKILPRRTLSQILKRQTPLPTASCKPLLPIKMSPLFSSNKLALKSFRSKSLSIAHNHIKYYKQKQRQKQNEYERVEIKENQIEELLRSLPKLGEKGSKQNRGENREKGKGGGGVNLVINQYESRGGVLEVVKGGNGERKGCKVTQEHFLDQMFGKLY